MHWAPLSPCSLFVYITLPVWNSELQTGLALCNKSSIQRESEESGTGWEKLGYELSLIQSNISVVREIGVCQTLSMGDFLPRSVYSLCGVCWPPQWDSDLGMGMCVLWMMESAGLTKFSKTSRAPKRLKSTVTYLSMWLSVAILLFLGGS